MKIEAIKTNKITQKYNDINTIIKQNINQIKENSILAISSKILSICEGNVVPITTDVDKNEIIKEVSDWFLPAELNKYKVPLSIVESTLVPFAGIDESNGDGYYILLPENPYDSANKIRRFLEKEYNVKNIGVIITDSTLQPLKWGTMGISIGYSGFKGVREYRGKHDLFGRKMKMTVANIKDSLATSAVLCMGEGAEQTPLALISELDFLEFTGRDINKKEIEALKIEKELDLYGFILESVKWNKGKNKKTFRNDDSNC